MSGIKFSIFISTVEGNYVVPILHVVAHFTTRRRMEGKLTTEMIFGLKILKNYIKFIKFNEFFELKHIKKVLLIDYKLFKKE